MNNFERQVAEAIIEATNDVGGDPCDVALIAPRVAAAIEAAAHSSWNQAIKTRGCVSEDVVDQAWHTASLFALRGD